MGVKLLFQTTIKASLFHLFVFTFESLPEPGIIKCALGYVLALSTLGFDENIFFGWDAINSYYVLKMASNGFWIFSSANT